MTLAVAAAAFAAVPSSAADALSVAVLPMANYTDDPGLLDLVVPQINDGFRSVTTRLFTADELRPTLRQYRIRAVGAIDAQGARAIASRADVNYLLLGSIDVYASGQVPEAGISLRLLHVESMTIVWAASAAATGEDFVSLLDRGRISDPVELIQRLVSELRDNLRDTAGSPSFVTRVPNGPRIAVIPFDNHDPAAHSGSVVSTHLLTGLVSSGLNVCEPGLVHAMLQRHGRVFRGEIDLMRLGILRDSLGIDAVITGHVQQFTSGASGSAMPHVEIGARMIDASTGHIVSTFQWERDGAQTETVFGLGATHAIGRLTQMAAADLIDHLGLGSQPPTLGKK